MLILYTATTFSLKDGYCKIHINQTYLQPKYKWLQYSTAQHSSIYALFSKKNITITFDLFSLVCRNQNIFQVQSVSLYICCTLMILLPAGRRNNTRSSTIDNRRLYANKLFYSSNDELRYVWWLQKSAGLSVPSRGFDSDSGKNSKNRELTCTFQHIELPAELLDYF